MAKVKTHKTASVQRKNLQNAVAKWNLRNFKKELADPIGARQLLLKSNFYIEPKSLFGCFNRVDL
jgi:hypothetical protein